jgi:hypothetical protein
MSLLELERQIFPLGTFQFKEEIQMYERLKARVLCSSSFTNLDDRSKLKTFSTNTHHFLLSNNFTSDQIAEYVVAHQVIFPL